MLYLSIFLLILGAVLFIIEMFIPGFGIFGASGIICVVASSVITVMTMQFGYLIVIGELFLVVLVFFGFFRYIKSKQLYGKLILNETLNVEEREIADPEFFLNKVGITKTPLKPYGSVDFNGVAINVFSDGEYIQGNEKVKVVSVFENKIIVKRTEESKAEDGKAEINNKN